MASAPSWQSSVLYVNLYLDTEVLLSHDDSLVILAANEVGRRRDGGEGLGVGGGQEEEEVWLRKQELELLRRQGRQLVRHINGQRPRRQK